MWKGATVFRNRDKDLRGFDKERLYMLKVVNNTTRYGKNVYSRY